jgi:hypothetical protein
MIGHNNPPHAIALDEAREFEAACLALATISNEDDAAKAAILIDREVKGRKAAETARTTEKKPHMDAAKEVDECWKPVTDVYQKAVLIVKAAVLDWQKRERARLDAEREAARIEAERAQEAAMDALIASSADDIWGEIKAAQKVAEADAAAEKVNQLETTFAPMQVRAEGIRARAIKLAWSVDVIDAEAMTKALASNAEVQAAALKVANSMARTMKDAFKLDGCKVKSVETL